MVHDRHLEDEAAVAKRPFVVPKASVGNSESDTEIGEKTPGKKFVIDSVEVYCTGTAATASVDVKVAGTSILSSPVTPSANDVVKGSLVSDIESRYGGLTDAITVHVTTDGTGTISDLRVEVSYRIRG